MADTPNSTGGLSERRQAEVVADHLPAGYSYAAGLTGTSEGDSVSPGSSRGRPSESHGSPSRPGAGPVEEQQAESSLLLQGGDIHRDLFKLNHSAAAPQLQRSRTIGAPETVPSPSPAPPDLTAADHLVPGGFRRAFLQQKKHRLGWDINSAPITRNFVEFLDLYGDFVGEDLRESEEEEEETEEEEEAAVPAERRPLLPRRGVKRARSAVRRKADAGTAKSFFTLLKAFVGTGIMFLPKAFNNGGILFSTVTMLAVAVITFVAFHLLLKCRARCGGGGYGELGEAIAGARMRSLILASVTISQIGFVCAGIVFVAENLRAFFAAVLPASGGAGTEQLLSTRALIALQLAALVPLSFIRNISKLGPAALLADVFILVGVTYIYYFDVSVLATKGLAPTVQLFNPAHYTLTVGAAIFAFEGIGLILPIRDSMRSPHRFEPLLALVMVIITLLFTSVGALCYAALGADTKTEVIANFPQDSPLVNAVQFLYSLAVLVGTPVQLFPALRILEGRVFGRRSGKADAATKWRKNAFRAALVCVCGGVSVLGAGNLDRFVALIGSFACVPLVYIYPPFLHYRGVAETGWEKGGDLVMMAGGVVAMVYTTAVTVVNSFMQA
ncbi:Vacuolar amino acid transporter 3 [Pleurostoma richardsiae]|uniref:Vacuolar amino acid transporter 3 n=1 Tax=Pleurostoma richardsiae TaxID=41990 RepID=A0AA38RHN1_9PEZI|nr:Vacuolar amino acid transporter 3 [Pleurostoma richardsiae]